MPTYTYTCECNTEVEVQHSMNETPELICEKCNTLLRKKFAAPQIQFKGEGFYSNDK